MTGHALRYFLDEDVFAVASPPLRSAGLDCVSAREAGRLGESDESQLDWATSEGRALVTFNVAHFAAMHGQWLDQARHHAGIVVSSQRPLRDFLRRLMHLAQRLDAAAMQDRLEFLSDW